MNLLLFNEKSMRDIAHIEPNIAIQNNFHKLIRSNMSHEEKVVVLNEELKKVLSFLVVFYEGLLYFSTNKTEGTSHAECLEAYTKAASERAIYIARTQPPVGLLVSQLRNLVKATQYDERTRFSFGEGLYQLIGRYQVMPMEILDRIFFGTEETLNLSNIINQVIYKELEITKSTRTLVESDFEGFYERVESFVDTLFHGEHVIYPYKIHLKSDKKFYYCIPRCINREVDLSEVFLIEAETVDYAMQQLDADHVSIVQNNDNTLPNNGYSLPNNVNELPNNDFRMPAEWVPHEATFMLWPHRSDIWKNSARDAELNFTKVAQAINAFEPVYVVVTPLLAERAKFLLGEDIQVVEKPYSDAWMRDIGPTVVYNQDNQRIAKDWVFNAWGGLTHGLYADFFEDDLVASKVSDVMKIENQRVSDVILEGGSIHTDGEGTLLSTRECLFNAGRNAYDEPLMEAYLKYHLGVDTIIWLDYGLKYDETNGHIDNICCFIRPGEVMLAWTQDMNHPSYERVRLAKEILENSVDSKGRNLIIHLVMLPDSIVLPTKGAEQKDEVFTTLGTTCHDLLPASYINFYFCNDAVILPQFNVELDSQVMEQFQQIFPDKSIIGVDSREIILGGGNIHCITQQIPASLKSE